MLEGGYQPPFKCLFVLRAFIDAKRNKVGGNKLHRKSSQSNCGRAIRLAGILRSIFRAVNEQGLIFV